MRVLIKSTPKEVALTAADILCADLRKTQKLTLGLPSGNTPALFYKELIARYESNLISFKDCISFNLDEYISKNSSESQTTNSSKHCFKYQMDQAFLLHIDIKPDNTFIPNHLTADPVKECEYYEQKIKEKGGIDLQFLGIGPNGHIGFNEPSSSLGSRTRVVSLSKQTMADNRAYFTDEVLIPSQAMTMGIGTILEARHIILLAFGQKKAKAIAAALEGPVTAMNPASALQLHSNVTFIIDEEAAQELTLKDYYLTASC